MMVLMMYVIKRKREAMKLTVVIRVETKNGTKLVLENRLMGNFCIMNTVKNKVEITEQGETNVSEDCERGELLCS